MSVYGRLDIYWPDGPIQSYQLDKQTVAIGRSSGNDIMLDTSAISRYHISIGYKDDQVVLEDLDTVNGTYVDGMRLPAHEQRVLRGGEEVQIGDVRLIYHPLNEQEDTQESLPPPQRTEGKQPTFTVEIDGPDQARHAGRTHSGTDQYPERWPGNRPLLRRSGRTAKRMDSAGS